MELLGLLAVPLVVAAIGALAFRATITLKEVFVQFAGASLVMVAGFFIARYCGMLDTEHLHGRITGKPHGSQKCCHCREVCDRRDKNGRCTRSHEECSHSRDYWWSLDTTLGRIEVEGCEPVDYAPAVWRQARIGEPAAIENSYVNYLRADPESLFVRDIESKYRSVVPDYPSLYELYKLNSVISDGPAFPPSWQDEFGELNADLGPREQVDVTVLVTRIQDPSYAQAVEAKWLYGPKNSMTVVMGVEGERITWARVVSISRIEELKIALRDGLQGKRLTDNVPAFVRAEVAAKFKRTPMAEFEYLASSASPPTGWLVFLYVFGAALSVGCSVYLHRTDVFGDERPFKERNPFSRSYFR